MCDKIIEKQSDSQEQMPCLPPPLKLRAFLGGVIKKDVNLLVLKFFI